MIRFRRASDRGHADHGWLNTHHTFSFAEYHDPEHVRFRSLRVMNEDRVAPGQGFGSHPHRDMEIVSYVLAGALEHKDSMGNGEVLKPGEFQRISAGTGVVHSEFNPSSTDPVHFYQIWLTPERTGIEPSYEQKWFEPSERRNQLRLVASPDGEQGSLTIHQDVRIYLSTLEPGNRVLYQLESDRHAWLQVLHGSVDFADQTLIAGDGVAISGESLPKIEANNESEVLLFDLA